MEEENSRELYRRDETRIDIADDNDEKLASSIENMMSHNSLMSTKCCIFKTPSILFRHDRKAYVPRAFSIGPLHHGKRHLKDTEKIKLQYLHGLISRAPTQQTSLKNLIKSIREIEREARECYAVPLDHFSIYELVKIMVLDGCFIIELLRKYFGDSPRDTNDPIFNMPCMSELLDHDLILLENQIPWLVLDCLFNMTTHPHSESLTKLAFRYFYRCNLTKTSDMAVDTNHRSKHMLDLYRNVLVLPSGVKKGHWYEGFQLIPSATSLVEAGIKFKKSTTSHSILDIKFSNGVLEIPPLVIQDTTGDVFRNLISFEQCHHDCTAMITSYVIFLDNLITSTKDLNLLRQHGIINNWLIPEEAIKFFNKLYNDTCVKEFYYVELCNGVNEYCQHRWPKWRAMYVRNHFSSPWAIASQVFAASMLLLTFLQTLYTIKM